ncbi:MAG: phosphoribosylformimino-5-aminoimidazole carboxamide ribotide isomerase [Victivallales bacterium]|jgi:phosphoribosylformimino-5-aminoimidazole carboxamide ribotide isomerase|nr:phosphoribosylformimino-5-aminoimidazole carboxamide ribotide isomerase [Victivallales bacterium]
MSLFRPCIDLHEGRVKQIVGGTLSDTLAELKTNFVAEHDSAWYAELYRSDELCGGHVIKLEPGNDQAAKRALAAWRGGLQIGGGINNENAREWLDAGAAQLIVTSYIFSNGQLQLDNLKKLFAITGRNRLVLDLSCRRKADGKYYIVTDRWQKYTSSEVNAETLNFLADFACEFLIHAVDVEGKQAGIDEELLMLLAQNSPIPCVYAGGIANFSDITKIERAGMGKIAYTVGSALDIFGGKLSYFELVTHAKNLKILPLID